MIKGKWVFPGSDRTYRFISERAEMTLSTACTKYFDVEVDVMKAKIQKLFLDLSARISSSGANAGKKNNKKKQTSQQN